MQWFVVPHLYATDEIVSNRVWIGIGEYSEYGLGSAYDNNWLGRYNSIDTRLESYTVSPVVAVKVTEDLSLAAGPRIMYLDFYNKRANAMRLGNRIVQAGTSEIEGSSYGYGWLVGANYRLTEDWTFGAVYRSRVYQQIDNGEVDFGSDYPQYVPSDRVGAEADIIMPSSATLGTNYKLLDKKLDIGTDVTWTEWSTYDSLNIIFDRPMRGTGRTADISEKDWSDVWRYGFGASYQLLDWMSVMGGYVFDMDPINRENTDFMLPSGNRNLFSFGLGFTYADFTLQVAYTYVFLVDTAREVDGADNGVRAKSTFCDTDSHVISMSRLHRKREPRGCRGPSPRTGVSTPPAFTALPRLYGSGAAKQKETALGDGRGPSPRTGVSTPPVFAWQGSRGRRAPGHAVFSF
jgi:long-chain fatty acid transport protein